jgi:hypothetical protein
MPAPRVKPTIATISKTLRTTIVPLSRFVSSAFDFLQPHEGAQLQALPFRHSQLGHVQTFSLFSPLNI